MSEFIPHQLHLTKPQIRKLMTGKGVNIPYAHMGSDKGSAVVMLHPANAKRLLTGFRKSKGVRIALTPAEMEMSATEGRGFNIGKAFKKLGHTIERGAKKTFTPKLGRDIVSGLEKGSGLFKMLHKIGISKKSAIKGIKDVGKKAVRLGATALGTAIGAYAGNPMAGAMIGDALGRAGEVGLDSMQPSKHGVRFDRGEAVSSLKKDMTKLAKDKLEELVDERVPPEYRGIAHQVLAGERLDKIAQQEMEKRMGETAHQMSKRITGDGVRQRGRPRKLVGSGAKDSSAYKKALANNFSGLTLTSADAPNRPASAYAVNPVVRPSSDEMTLSPYQGINSPAMNPFIPTYYTQQGGTQSGYGGRGLYGGGLF